MFWANQHPIHPVQQSPIASLDNLDRIKKAIAVDFDFGSLVALSRIDKIIQNTNGIITHSLSAFRSLDNFS